MSRRWVSVVAGLCASLVAGCGGGDASERSNPTTVVTAPAPATTTTTQRTIEGVQTFQVDAGHSATPVRYPQVPPVGGLHDPVWQPCGFYDQPVPNEKGVHSLEHGAVWITYRADLPQAQIDGLAALARSRNLVLVSRFDDGLPAPVVATAWGRQLRLESTGDPRLLEFIRAYINQGPEINGPC